MPRIHVEFIVGNEVIIKPFSKSGRIVSILMSVLGTTYLVRYYNDNVPVESYFLASEMEAK